MSENKPPSPTYIYIYNRFWGWKQNTFSLFANKEKQPVLCFSSHASKKGGLHWPQTARRGAASVRLHGPQGLLAPFSASTSSKWRQCQKAQGGWYYCTRTQASAHETPWAAGCFWTFHHADNGRERERPRFQSARLCKHWPTGAWAMSITFSGQQKDRPRFQSALFLSSTTLCGQLMEILWYQDFNQHDCGRVCLQAPDQWA